MERLIRSETTTHIKYTLGHTRWSFDKREHSRLQEVFDGLYAHQSTGLDPEEVLRKEQADEIAFSLILLNEYQKCGPVKELRALKEAEQKRREGCEYCRPDRDDYVKTLGGFTIHNGKLCAKGLKPRKINQCFMCGRDLRGESHDGD